MLLSLMSNLLSTYLGRCMHVGVMGVQVKHVLSIQVFRGRQVVTKYIVHTPLGQTHLPHSQPPFQPHTNN